MQSSMYQDKFTPHEHALYLPYSQAHVNVVYFDAKEVLRSLLTCPVLNKDDTYHVPQHSAPRHLQPICEVRRENPVRHQYWSFLPQNLWPLVFVWLPSPTHIGSELIPVAANNGPLQLQLVLHGSCTIVSATRNNPLLLQLIISPGDPMW